MIDAPQNDDQSVQRDGVIRFEPDYWRIQPHTPEQVSGNQWFDLRVELPANERPVTVVVHWPPVRSNSSGEYGGNHQFLEVLDRVLFLRLDDEPWRRVTDAERIDDHVRFILPPGGAGRELAVGMPVDVMDLWLTLDRAEEDGQAKVEVIGASPAGHALYAITIGDPDAAEGIFVISAYQHFSEWAGIRAVAELVDHLLSDSGVQLRQRWCWWIYPCINVDALQDGWPADPVIRDGVNLNRDWTEFTRPETQAVRDHLLTSNDHAAPVLRGLDLHMGWHSAETCGAGLTVFTDGDEPAGTPRWIVDAQHRFAERLMADVDYTDFIWHAGRVDRPNFAAWFTRTFNVPGQTLEISRHRWLDRATGRWVPPSEPLEQALGRGIAESLNTFHGKRTEGSVDER